MKATSATGATSVSFRVCEGAGEAACEPFAYLSDGQLIIDAGDASNGDASNGDAFNVSLQMFDILGHQLLSKEFSVLRSPFSVSHFPTGVYVLRLINGNDVKTQKIVIQ